MTSSCPGRMHLPGYSLLQESISTVDCSRSTAQRDCPLAGAPPKGKAYASRACPPTRPSRLQTNFARMLLSCSFPSVPFLYFPAISSPFRSFSVLSFLFLVVHFSVPCHPCPFLSFSFLYFPVSLLLFPFLSFLSFPSLSVPFPSERRSKCQTKPSSDGLKVLSNPVNRESKAYACSERRSKGQTKPSSIGLNVLSNLVNRKAMAYACSERRSQGQTKPSRAFTPYP